MEDDFHGDEDRAGKPALVTVPWQPRGLLGWTAAYVWAVGVVFLKLLAGVGIAVATLVCLLVHRPLEKVAPRARVTRWMGGWLGR